MRLVKKTVNQDDVSAYHLFYADGAARPGPTSPSSTGRSAASGAARTASPAPALRVAGAGTLAWWKERFEDLGRRSTAMSSSAMRRLTLDFEDFEGQRLSLVDDGGAGRRRIRGSGARCRPSTRSAASGPITISVPDLEPTDRVLTTGAWT